MTVEEFCEATVPKARAYYKQMELQENNNKEKEMTGCLSKDVLMIWYERKVESVDRSKKNKIGYIIDSDQNVQAIKKHIDDANSIISNLATDVPITPNYSLYLSKESRDEISKIKENAADEIKKLDALKKEIRAMLVMCDGRSDKEAAVLNNYGITNGLYGRLTV